MPPPSSSASAADEQKRVVVFAAHYPTEDRVLPDAKEKTVVEVKLQWRVPGWEASGATSGGQPNVSPPTSVTITMQAAAGDSVPALRTAMLPPLDALCLVAELDVLADGERRHHTAVAVDVHGAAEQLCFASVGLDCGHVLLVAVHTMPAEFVATSANRAAIGGLVLDHVRLYSTHVAHWAIERHRRNFETVFNDLIAQETLLDEIAAARDAEVAHLRHQVAELTEALAAARGQASDGDPASGGEADVTPQRRAEPVVSGTPGAPEPIVVVQSVGFRDPLAPKPTIFAAPMSPLSPRFGHALNPNGSVIIDPALLQMASPLVEEATSGNPLASHDCSSAFALAGGVNSSGAALSPKRSRSQLFPDADATAQRDAEIAVLRGRLDSLMASRRAEIAALRAKVKASDRAKLRRVNDGGGSGGGSGSGRMTPGRRVASPVASTRSQVVSRAPSSSALRASNSDGGWAANSNGGGDVAAAPVSLARTASGTGRKSPSPGARVPSPASVTTRAARMTRLDQATARLHQRHSEIVHRVDSLPLSGAPDSQLRHGASSSSSLAHGRNTARQPASSVATSRESSRTSSPGRSSRPPWVSNPVGSGASMPRASGRTTPVRSQSRTAQQPQVHQPSAATRPKSPDMRRLRNASPTGNLMRSSPLKLHKDLYDSSKRL